MNDIGHTLDAMDSTRLLLALLFVAGYASSIGSLASERIRRWSVALAALTGLAFVGLTNPWVHGALLVIFGVLGVGVFIALAWGFSAWALRQQEQPSSADLAVELAAAHPAVPVIRRVRRLRRRLSAL